MDQIVVHGSYLINAGSCDMQLLDRARACMLDECRRCEQLGIIYYNIHPGNIYFTSFLLCCHIPGSATRTVEIEALILLFCDRVGRSREF